MATVRDSLPHTVRTANDPRQRGLYSVTLSHIEQINSRIRLLKLSLPKDGPPFRHLPGQYVDLYIPGIPQAGGFTITSPPQTAILHPLNPNPYIELAIQLSTNPPVAWLWLAQPMILNTELQLRVGGNFVYPPATLSLDECKKIDKAVFVAGGVGINPIMSMLSAMHARGPAKESERVGGIPRRVHVLYAVRRVPIKNEGKSTDSATKYEEVLFQDRISKISHAYNGSQEVDFRFTMFETGRSHDKAGEVDDIEVKKRRVSDEDLEFALGPSTSRSNTVVYVCGPPAMTDSIVNALRSTYKMDEKRVLCEKWW